MSHLNKLLRIIKSKTAVIFAAGTLVLTPTGVALAHGGDDNGRRGDGNNRSRSAQFNQDKNHRKDDDNKHHNQPNTTTCEQRQANATQKVNDYKNRAQQHFNGLGLYLTNQQTFVNTNNLNVENYGALNQKAEEAKTAANNALTNTQPPTIDCNQSEKKDNETIFRSINDLRKSMRNFESSVQKLSETVIDKIAVS